MRCWTFIGCGNTIRVSMRNRVILAVLVMILATSVGAALAVPTARDVQRAASSCNAGTKALGAGDGVKARAQFEAPIRKV